MSESDENHRPMGEGYRREKYRPQFDNKRTTGEAFDSMVYLLRAFSNKYPHDSLSDRAIGVLKSVGEWP